MVPRGNSWFAMQMTDIPAIAPAKEGSSEARRFITSVMSIH